MHPSLHVHPCIIWSSVHEWKEVGALLLGDTVVAAGPPDRSEEPVGAVELRYLKSEPARQFSGFAHAADPYFLRCVAFCVFRAVLGTGCGSIGFGTRFYTKLTYRELGSSHESPFKTFVTLLFKMRFLET